MDTSSLYVQPISAWVLLAAVFSLLLNILVTRGWGSADREPLTAAEYGLLVSDERAVLAALTELRATNLLDVGSDLSLDPFTGGVLRNYQHVGRPSFRRLVGASSAELKQLQRSLVHRGLLRGPLRAVLQYLTAIPALGGLALCLTKLADTSVLPEPGYQIVIVLVVSSIAALFCLRTPRATAAGFKTLAAARETYARWHPSNEPAFETYDRQYAAISAALFGGRALWHLDAELAKQWSVNASVDANPSQQGDR